MYYIIYYITVYIHIYYIRVHCYTKLFRETPYCCLNYSTNFKPINFQWFKQKSGNCRAEKQRSRMYFVTHSFESFVTNYNIYKSHLSTNQLCTNSSYVSYHRSLNWLLFSTTLFRSRSRVILFYYISIQTTVRRERYEILCSRLNNHGWVSIMAERTCYESLL